jgi:hypothetical protein
MDCVIGDDGIDHQVLRFEGFGQGTGRALFFLIDLGQIVKVGNAGNLETVSTPSILGCG